MGIILFGAIIAVLSTLLWVFLTSREPIYGNRSLTYWLRVLEEPSRSRSQRDEAAEAVRKIGSEAVPHLIRMVGSPDFHFRATFYRLADSILGGKRTAIIVPNSRNNRGLKGFEVLGKQARTATPDLGKMIRRGNQSSAFFASQALVVLVNAGAGEEALPALTNILLNGEWNSRVAVAQAMLLLAPTSESEESAVVNAMMRSTEDTNRALRSLALANLGGKRWNNSLIIPSLVKGLSDREPGIRSMAARSLGDYGQDATNALGALRNLLHDEVGEVRLAATNALKKIAP